MATRRRTTKPAAPVEPELVEDDTIEELEEAEVEEAPAPKKKAAAKKAAAPKAEEPAALGTSWLVDHVNEQLGTEYKAYDLRIVLRKLAKAGKLERNVGEERGRYTFSGPTDPVVKALVKALKDGELEKDRKEKLAELKAKKASSKKTAPAEAEEVELEEDDEEDIEDL